VHFNWARAARTRSIRACRAPDGELHQAPEPTHACNGAARSGTDWSCRRSSRARRPTQSCLLCRRALRSAADFTTPSWPPLDTDAPDKSPMVLGGSPRTPRCRGRAECGSSGGTMPAGSSHETVIGRRRPRSRADALVDLREQARLLQGRACRRPGAGGMALGVGSLGRSASTPPVSAPQNPRITPAISATSVPDASTCSKTPF